MLNANCYCLLLGSISNQPIPVSNEHMRRSIISLGLIALALCAWAQPPSPTINERAAIEQAKNLPASSFDSRLPRVPLEYFLAYEVSGAPGKWMVAECEKQPNNPSVGTKHNSALCVRTEYELKNGDFLTLLIFLGEAQNGEPDGEAIVRLTVGGHVRQFRSLGDLPMELHRPPYKGPSKTPRDLPSPARDG